MDAAVAILSWTMCALGHFLMTQGVAKRSKYLLWIGRIVALTNIAMCVGYVVFRISDLTAFG